MKHLLANLGSWLLRLMGHGGRSSQEVGDGRSVILMVRHPKSTHWRLYADRMTESRVRTCCSMLRGWGLRVKIRYS